MDVERLPTAPVCRYMTADLVTAAPETPLDILARLMIDAHVHRVIVIDAELRPIGLVTSTDVLAAVAYHAHVAGAEVTARSCEVALT